MLIIATISYWAIGLHPGATAFFRFTLYLFLGVMAAESQSIFVAAAIPIFVAALALASFINGFWMVIASLLHHGRSSYHSPFSVSKAISSKPPPCLASGIIGPIGL